MDAQEFLAAEAVVKLKEADRLFKIGRELLKGAEISGEYLSRMGTSAAGITQLILSAELRRLQKTPVKNPELINRLEKSIAALDGINKHDAFEATVFTGIMIGVALAVELELR